MKLSDRFKSLPANEKALVLFFTAGDQPLSDLGDILECLTEAGADAIEVGIPFSDPFGEGLTIQASSQRSLENGTSVRGVLDAIAASDARVPLITMGYYNPVLRYGLEKFAVDAASAGVSGVILSDLVPDEGLAWCDTAQRNGLDTIFLVAPTSTEQRLNEVAAQSTGFVYVVSRTGVTGAESAVPDDVQDLVRRVKSRTDRPACVGFGVSKPEHVRMVSTVADGAVVGSALVSRLHEHWGKPGGAATIQQFVRELKAATRS